MVVSIANMDEVRKGLVGVTLELAIIEIGGARMLNEVFRLLHEKCHGYLPDCYEHPEYLKKIAPHLDEGMYALLMSTVQERLAEFSYQEPIERFILNTAA